MFFVRSLHGFHHFFFGFLCLFFYSTTCTSIFSLYFFSIYTTYFLLQMHTHITICFILCVLLPILSQSLSPFSFHHIRALVSSESHRCYVETFLDRDKRSLFFSIFCSFSVQCLLHLSSVLYSISFCQMLSNWEPISCAFCSCCGRKQPIL